MRWVEIREIVQMSFWCGMGFAAGALLLVGLADWLFRIVRWVMA